MCVQRNEESTDIGQRGVKEMKILKQKENKHINIKEDNSSAIVSKNLIC